MIEIDKFARLQKDWSKCVRCKIGKWAFSKAFHSGSLAPIYAFIGEGPGASEDVLGEPFVGVSGKLLRDAINKTGYASREFCLLNLVLCRPCDKANGPNRAPNQTEITNCSPRLAQTLRILKPKVLIGVGTVPMEHLTEKYDSYILCKIKHPAYILRTGGLKSKEYDEWLESLKSARVQC